MFKQTITAKKPIKHEEKKSLRRHNNCRDNKDLPSQNSAIATITNNAILTSEYNKNKSTLVIQNHHELFLKVSTGLSVKSKCNNT